MELRPKIEGNCRFFLLIESKKTGFPGKQERKTKMEKQRLNTFRMVMLAMMVAIGVVISPILT